MTYVDPTVTAGNTYAYRVRAVYGAVRSAFSNSAAVIVPSAPAAPSNFTATTLVTGATARIDLSWQDKSNNETRFVIQRPTDPAFGKATTFTVAANTTKLTQSSLPRRTTYYYRVAAQNSSGQSVWVNLTPFPITTP